MAYQATILNVMIASPSDVAEERQIVREAIYEWNAIHSKQFGVVLNPIGWETHVAPEMGNRPQEIINKSILNDSDILIGIFWTRLGSPTGEFTSGTVEEITKHIAANKLTSIYICDRPLSPSQITDQYQKLKNQIEEWKPRGVLHFYNDLIVFKQKLIGHLTFHIQKNEYLKVTSNPINLVSKENNLISEEAMTLLLNAVEGNGIISYCRYVDGTADFDAHKFNYRTKNSRDIATWKAAIHYMLLKNIIVELNNHDGIRQICELTDIGWDLAEILVNKNKANQ